MADINHEATVEERVAMAMLVLHVEKLKTRVAGGLGHLPRAAEVLQAYLDRTAIAKMNAPGGGA